MAFVPEEAELPNLKIEIENDLDEDMRTEEDEEKEAEKSGDGEMEEGEVSDDNSDVEVNIYLEPAAEKDREKRYNNRAGAFVTGVDVLGKDAQERLQERAKRFGIESSQVRTITPGQVKALYESLGIKEEEVNSGKPTSQHRLEALHMRGTTEMSTEDVFNYFRDYGPASIEWINDHSCNVVWLDEISAARALLALTRPIQGLTETAVAKDPFTVTQEKEDEEEDMREKTGKKEEVVIVPEEDEKEDGDVTMDTDEEDKEGEKEEESGEREEAKSDQDEAKSAVSGEEEKAVKASTISTPIPPGLWRLGVQHAKGKDILLRFATRADKKTRGAEKMSQYYQKYGNPNYGGIKGIITSSRKRKFWEEKQKKEAQNIIEGVKNPWGSLAQSWGNQERRRDRPFMYERDSPPPPSSPPPRLRTPSAYHSPTSRPSSRLSPRSGSPSDANSSDSSDDVQWNRRLKRPRMRMHADDEQCKIEQRRERRTMQHRLGDIRNSVSPVQFIDSQQWRGDRVAPRVGNTHINHRTNDLRNRLGRDSRSGNSANVWSRLQDKEYSEETGSETEEEETSWALEDDDYDELRNSVARRGSGLSDLRSKLNKRQESSTLSQKSPLRIEIDNDEYYRVIDSDNE